MTRKSILAAALALALSTAAGAQQELSFRAPVTSTEINPDHSVTFRYRNPKAVTVQLQGDMFSDGKPVQMTEGADGVNISP